MMSSHLEISDVQIGHFGLRVASEQSCLSHPAPQDVLNTFLSQIIISFSTEIFAFNYNQLGVIRKIRGYYDKLINS